LISSTQFEPVFLRSFDQFDDHDPCFVAGKAAFCPLCRGSVSALLAVDAARPDCSLRPQRGQ
jgi:hypothetical protein